MLKIFNPKETKSKTKPESDFGYLESSDYYFDSACQTLRPQEVIDAEIDYYHNFNSCGHRVKYKWGEKTDKLVEECRQSLIKLVGKSSRDYTVAFNLNTTAGINQVLFQLPSEKFTRIITSQIEHNSVFLPTMEFAKKFNKPRLVLDRQENGALNYKLKNLQKSIVIVNSTSNIHGLNLTNVRQLAKDVHEQGGILLLDACQTFGHNPKLLEEVDFDAVFGSGHKMYGPSIGFVIIKKSLLKSLKPYLIGGSTVQNVSLDSYELVQNDSDIYARIEPGLQNYAGIIGLKKALQWHQSWRSLDKENSLDFESSLAKYLNQKLKEIKNINLLNPEPSPVVSLYSDKIDGHRLGFYLAEAGIMCRTGYHCCHYYLIKKLKLPPLFRISLGLNNTKEQIDYLIEKLRIVVKN